MEKRGMSRKWVVLLIVVFIIIILIALAVSLYALYTGKNYDDQYDGRVERGELVNPVINLTDEEAVLEFNESFVYYLMYNIKAYNLHETPMGNSKPEIEIHVGQKIFNAEIDAGEIIVGNGEIGEKDVVIRTSPEEAVKMIRDKNYITDSFSAGKSSIELVESKTTLFGKGYMEIYKGLTGKEAG